MVISFEEKDRAAIESRGITIIEFKRFLYKGVKTTIKALNSLMEWFLEAIDNVNLIVEQISDYTCRPTSFRYEAVKFLSKCTGIDMYKLWGMTRRTWLARSCI